MAELRSSTSIGGNLAWHSGNLRFDTQGNTIRYAGFKLYSENDKPTPAEVGAVNKTGDTMTGQLVMDRTSIVVTNPTNGTAINSFGYINNIPSIRYGGTGAGSGAGFNIASSSDIVKFRVAEDGELYANGTKQVLHVLNYTTTLDSVYAKRAQSDTITGAWTFNSVPTFNAASANGPASILIGDKEVHKGSDSGIYLRSGSNTLGINGSNIPVFNGSRLTRVDQTETISASWSFTAIPSSSVAPTTGAHVVNKTYADQQDALRLALTGGTLTGALAGTYYKTNDAGAATAYGDANYGFYVYGRPDSSSSYGMTLIDPAANGQWGTNIFAAGESSRFVYFSKKTGASAAYTSFAVAAKIDVATGEIYAAGGTKQVLHTGNYTTTLDSRYVQKTGDSMSGTLTTPEVVISGTSGGTTITKGTIDGATSASANVQFKSWYGIGFAPTISGQPVPLNENAVWINVRNGQLNARGNIYANNDALVLTVNNYTTTLDSRYVNKTGDSMSGALTITSAAGSPGIRVGSTTHKAGVGPSSISGEYLFGGNVTGGTTFDTYVRVGQTKLTYSPDGTAQYDIYHTGDKPTAADVSALSLAGGTLTGTLSFSNSGTTKRGISGVNGDNDSWFVGGGATAVNAGFLELATGDDATEPVYVRQYTGAAGSGTVTRTLTLLDGSGNTTIPGSLASIGGIDVSANQYIDFLTNSAGGYFRVGGNGYMAGSKSTVYGSIAVSNGNLHIDSGSDKWTYLNYYSGAGIYFGNGATGSSANVTAAGRFSGISYAWGTGYLDTVSGNIMSRFVDPTNHVGVFAGPNKSSILGSNYYFDGTAWQVRSTSYVANRLEITATGWEFYHRPAGGSDSRVALMNTVGGLSVSSVAAGGNVSAATFNGYAISGLASNNTIVLRDATGDISCRLFRPEYGDQTDVYGAIAFRGAGGSGTDNYLRFCNSPSAVRTWIGAPSTAVATTSVAGLMASADKIRANDTARTKSAAETTLWSGEASSSTTTITVSQSLYNFPAIRFEGINSDRTIAWTYTMAAHEWLSLCNGGYNIGVGGVAGYYFVFKTQSATSTTLTRHTNNVYLTRIVGIN